MNRRNFLAGLLATTAAVPLASAFAADMGAEPVVVWDVGESHGITYVWHRSALGFATTFEKVSPAFMREVTRWGPEPGTVWFDEACFISDHAWEYLTGVKLDAALDAQARGLDWRHTARLRDILDTQPVPDDSKLLWPTDDDVI